MPLKGKTAGPGTATNSCKFFVNFSLCVKSIICGLKILLILLRPLLVNSLLAVLLPISFFFKLGMQILYIVHLYGKKYLYLYLSLKSIVIIKRLTKSYVN